MRFISRRAPIMLGALLACSVPGVLGAQASGAAAPAGASGPTGSVSLSANLTALPSSTGPVSATVGQTIWLQYWYRDFVGVSTSNLSNALQVKVKP